jgi:hypothetical protein
MPRATQFAASPRRGLAALLAPALALIAASALAQPAAAPPSPPAAGATGATGRTAPSSVTAAPQPSPESALALQQQVRAWLSGLLGPAVTLPDQLFTMAPAGDHYLVSTGPALFPGLTVDGPATISAAARPLPEGRWSITDVQMPSPLRLRWTLPATSGRPARTMALNLTLGSQDMRATIDPSLNSASTMSSKVRGYDAEIDGATTLESQHLDSYDAEASLTPAGDGHLNLTETLTGENFGATNRDPATRAAILELAAQRLHVSAHADGIAESRAIPALRELVTLAIGAAQTMPTDAPMGTSTNARAAAARDALRRLYLAWRGVLAGAAVSESLDGVRAVANGHNVALDHVGFGLGATTPAGMFAANLRIEANGIASPEIPPSVQPYMPQNVVLQPSISGIDLADLDALVMAETAPPGAHADIAPVVAAMFAHGGIIMGLDTLQLDLGPAHFTGAGTLTAVRQDLLQGNAELSATGFDALINQAKTEPTLAQALPYLTVMRAFGNESGDRIVWHITSENGDIKVNGTDLSAIFGRGGHRTHAPFR